jgi:hypothetical protein
LLGLNHSARETVSGGKVMFDVLLGMELGYELIGGGFTVSQILTSSSVLGETAVHLKLAVSRD